MRRLKLIGLVTMVVIAGFACQQGGGQSKGGQGTAATSKGGQGTATLKGCQQQFSAMDTNKDGQVSKEEFLAAPHQRSNPEAVFQAMDVNGQGYLTEEELCSGQGRGMGQGTGQGKGKGMGQGQGKGTSQ